MTNEAENSARFRAVIDRLNAHDLSVLDDCYTPDFLSTEDET